MASNLIPRPQNSPTSLTSLYRRLTSDHRTAPELILSVMRQQSNDRVLLVSLIMKGYSAVQISGALGTKPDTITKRLKRTMRSLWKLATNAPRYTNGRKKTVVSISTKVAPKVVNLKDKEAA